MTNNSTIDRESEVVAVSELDTPEEYIVLGADGFEIPSQVTYDGKLLFQAAVAAGEQENFSLVKAARRMPFAAIASGNIYPNRLDDIAWESDKIGYRVYSKRAGADGWTLYGYDVFTKIGSRPVLDDLYAAECDQRTRAYIKKLRDAGNELDAKILHAAISYHIDHGQGMDYYPVGKTLGCGTAALARDGEIFYPEYFRDYEILDNGGLRFTFKLVFDPVKIGEDMIVEERIISLDAGQHFNLVKVNFKNLTSESDVVLGLVTHDDAQVSQVRDISIAYAEPEHKYGWQTYVAAVFPESMTPSVKFFSQEEGKDRSATGHVLSQGVLKPGETMEYYMGAGWNRWCFDTADDWFAHVREQEIVLNEPLEYKLSK